MTKGVWEGNMGIQSVALQDPGTSLQYCPFPADKFINFLTRLLGMIFNR